MGKISSCDVEPCGERAAAEVETRLPGLDDFHSVSFKLLQLRYEIAPGRSAAWEEVQHSAASGSWLDAQRLFPAPIEVRQQGVCHFSFALPCGRQSANLFSARLARPASCGSSDRTLSTYALKPPPSLVF